MISTLITCRSKRNPNIEVFRCLLMFLIVLHHCTDCGYYQHDSSQVLIWLLFMGATMWLVDGFIAISGWFGIKFSWRKFFDLWGQFAFYTVVGAICIWGRDGSLKWKDFVVDGGWFGGTYLVLLFFAPLLNESIEAIVTKGIVKRVWSLMAIGVTLAWAPLHLMTGCFPSHGVAFSLVIFIFIYVTVRFARLSNLHFRWRWFWYAVGAYCLALLAFGGGYALSRLILHKPFCGWGVCLFTTYDAPHVWIMAILMLMFFAERVHVFPWLGHLCSFCAPSMFGVYLFHHGTAFGPLIYQTVEKMMAEDVGMHAVVNVLLAAVVTFVAGLLFDFIRRGIFRVGSIMLGRLLP